MKHIKEEYGSPCDKIESTFEEFEIMKDFLKSFGVEARLCSACGNKCEWQIRNGYKDWAHLYANNQITGQKIIDIVEEDIKNNSYAR